MITDLPVQALARIVQAVRPHIPSGFYGNIKIRSEKGTPVKVDVEQNHRVDKLPPVEDKVP